MMICVILLIALSTGCANVNKSSTEVQDNTYLSELSPEEILEKLSTPVWSTQMKNIIMYTLEMI